MSISETSSSINTSRMSSYVNNLHLLVTLRVSMNHLFIILLASILVSYKHHDWWVYPVAISLTCWILDFFHIDPIYTSPIIFWSRCSDCICFLHQQLKTPSFELQNMRIWRAYAFCNKSTVYFVSKNIVNKWHLIDYLQALSS